jgi:drug/metabolite transporter (DMT)-like permease
VLASSQFAGTLILGAALAPFGWVTPHFGDLALFIASGCISVGALLSVNRSLRLAPASVVVPYQYTMIVYAVIFGYLVFGDVPAAHTLAGAAIIIAAGFYIFLREQRLGRDNAEITPPPA